MGGGRARKAPGQGCCAQTLNLYVQEEIERVCVRVHRRTHQFSNKKDELLSVFSISKQVEKKMERRRESTAWQREAMGRQRERDREGTSAKASRYNSPDR